MATKITHRDLLDGYDYLSADLCTCTSTVRGVAIQQISVCDFRCHNRTPYASVRRCGDPYRRQVLRGASADRLLDEYIDVPQGVASGIANGHRRIIGPGTF